MRASTPPSIRSRSSDKEVDVRVGVGADDAGRSNSWIVALQFDPIQFERDDDGVETATLDQAVPGGGKERWRS